MILNLTYLSLRLLEFMDILVCGALGVHQVVQFNLNTNQINIPRDF